MEPQTIMCGLILRARFTTKTSRFRPVRDDALIGAVAASPQSKGITMATIAKAEHEKALAAMGEG